MCVPPYSEPSAIFGILGSCPEVELGVPDAGLSRALFMASQEPIRPSAEGLIDHLFRGPGCSKSRS